jgi:hypothetical protein
MTDEVQKLISESIALADIVANAEIEEAKVKSVSESTVKAYRQQVGLLENKIRDVESDKHEKLALIESRVKEHQEAFASKVKKARTALMLACLKARLAKYPRKAIDKEQVVYKPEYGRDSDKEKTYAIRTLYVNPLSFVAIHEAINEYAQDSYSRQRVNKFYYAIYIRLFADYKSNKIIAALADINDAAFTVHGAMVFSRDFKTEEEARQYAERNRGKRITELVAQMSSFDEKVQNAADFAEAFDFRLLVAKRSLRIKSSRTNRDEAGLHVDVEQTTKNALVLYEREGRWNSDAQEYETIIHKKPITARLAGLVLNVSDYRLAEQPDMIKEFIEDSLSVALDDVVIDEETGTDARTREVD